MCLFLTLWLIAGVCRRRLSIGSFCFPSVSAKPLCWERHVDSWQAPGVFTQSPKTSKLFICFHLGFLSRAHLRCLPLQSLILSSCVFSYGLVRRAGVALADGSVFKTSLLLKRVCTPPSLLVLVGASLHVSCTAANIAVIQRWQIQKKEKKKSLQVCF